MKSLVLIAIALMTLSIQASQSYQAHNIDIQVKKDKEGGGSVDGGGAS